MVCTNNLFTRTSVNVECYSIREIIGEDLAWCVPTLPHPQTPPLSVDLGSPRP